MVKIYQKKKTIFSIIALSTCFISSVALAMDTKGSNFGYTYIEGGAIATNFDDKIGDHKGMTGGYAGASYQPGDNVYFRIDGSYLRDKKSNTKINGSSNSFGIGFVEGVGDRADLTAVLNYMTVRAEGCIGSNCASATDTGLGIGVGVRYWMNEGMEINGGVQYTNFKDFDDTTALSIGMAFWMGDNSSIRATVAGTKDQKSAAIGYRYTFGR